MSTHPLDLGENFNGGLETFTNAAVPLILGMLVAGLVAIFSLGICGPPMTIGYYRLCLRAARGEEVKTGDVFDGFQYFGASWILMLIIAVGVIAASCTIVGGIVVAYLVFWAPTIMADGNRDAIDCLKKSYEYNTKEIGPAAVFWLVILVIQNVGHAVALGGLVTFPIASAMQSHGYLRAFAGEGMGDGGAGDAGSDRVSLDKP